MPVEETAYTNAPSHWASRWLTAFQSEFSFSMSVTLRYGLPGRLSEDGHQIPSFMRPIRGGMPRLGPRAAFDPSPFPVVSLYLNTRAGQHGRDEHDAFVRKEFKARSRTYPANSPERSSLERDLDRISRFLAAELPPPSNAAALFCCSARVC